MGGEPSVGFGKLDDAGSAEDKYRRELVRIRKSPSFRIGVHLITAVEKPWRLIFLPFSLPWLIFSLGLERLGKKAIPEFEQPNFEVTGNRKSIVMFPTNGVGFGHFTRLLSIARRIKKLDEEVEVIFFTTMPTLHLLKREGIPAYHLPGRKNSTTCLQEHGIKSLKKILQMYSQYTNPPCSYLTVRSPTEEC